MSKSALSGLIRPCTLLFETHEGQNEHEAGAVRGVLVQHRVISDLYKSLMDFISPVRANNQTDLDITRSIESPLVQY
jgi:hypothetical protein